MFKVAKIVEVGGKELQDRAEFFQLGSTLVLIVADGAGGLSGGAEAAEFVVRWLRESASPSNLSAEGLCQLLEQLDREMAGLGSYGETTAVVVALTATSIVGASVGDSEALVISPPRLDDLTANQLRKPFVGSGRAIPVGFARDELAGTLLLASDGLMKYTSQERLASVAVATDLNKAAQEMVALVRFPSGALPDDIAILLARKS